ncbi:bromodomain containing protein, putative [Entamoeba invadens IP1]|uniref:Bromodomain containing protein, putative n=1 Tax=Entamoeba invadens IP1 TaxID=370355 RepID=A0A0A1TYL5_ENTIV|nr:bromodomain containing protein, putative [Entamoeba invadens IP1]ELP86579.1 bromodomain containing protein, putative [Entamoeba invadens IP1]|eukprot:XP_004185925.1 bromodomain containing protein, putative [Entamoeba invadens IP1]
MSQQELVKCKDINRKLMSQDEGVAFNTPVDPVALRVPTYPTVIKYPMDLGTIKRKLGDKKYTTKDEFYMDVILTFQDAIYFNHPESEVHHWAVKLEGLFLKLWTTAFGATKPTAVDPRLPIALSQTVGTAPLEPLTPLYSLLNPSETGIEKNKAKTKKSSKRGEKIFTDAELQKLKCDLKTIEKDKEKMRRVFEIIRVDRKGKAEVSISLKSCTNEQLKELQEVVGLKSDGNKKVEEELEKLTGTQSIGKPQKAMDSESESELSSSCSADSPKSN